MATLSSHVYRVSVTQGTSPPLPRMSRDITPYGLRIPPELKERLQEESIANGRSLNAELLDRLRRTIEQQDLIARNGYANVQDSLGAPSAARTDAERAILAVFRGLPHEKQLALLSLFK